MNKEYFENLLKDEEGMLADLIAEHQRRFAEEQQHQQAWEKEGAARQMKVSHCEGGIIRLKKIIAAFEAPPEEPVIP